MYRYASKLLFLAVAILFSTASQASVWETQNQWDEQWEKSFSQFITDLPLTFFNNPHSPYGLIETDCADAAYVLRMIFAFENKLPVNFFNYDNEDLSNETSRYDSVPEGIERFNSFSRLVRRKTDTGTLINETYPIAINHNSVVPGAMLMHSAKSENVNGKNIVPMAFHSSHVYYVQSVTSSGMFNLISSTVPVAVRNLNLRKGYVFLPFNTNSGFRAWKWPNTSEVPLESRLNGSMEQFEINNWKPFLFAVEGLDEAMWIRLRNAQSAWTKAVRSRIGGATGTGKQIDAKEEWSASLSNVQDAMRERVDAVNSGWAAYQKRYSGRGCMNEGDYDNYSTPTRDYRLGVEISYLHAAADGYMKSARMELGKYAKIRFYKTIKFEIMPGKIIDMNTLVDTFLTNKINQISEPEHSPEVRWGVVQIEDSQWTCPQNNKYFRKSEKKNR